jgi:hypothetical protein
MSVAQPPTTPAPREREIIVVSHSNLFYWWPVWAVGFLMALLTWMERDHPRLVTVPTGSIAGRSPEVTIEKANKEKETLTDRDVVVLPKGKQLSRSDPRDPKSPIAQPRLQISRSKGYGVLFAVVLILCIVITNVPLRGMWSVLVIVTMVMLALIFHLAGWWETLLTWWWFLDIRINMGGYLFISCVLLAVWLLAVFVFDRRVYMVFTPGQFKVCTEVGGGEKVYDTFGMTLERHYTDLFRHWVLGLGSGDLVVRTTGAQAHQFDMPNVLFIAKKVQQIEELLKTKRVEGK